MKKLILDPVSVALISSNSYIPNSLHFKKRVKFGIEVLTRLGRSGSANGAD